MAHLERIGRKYRVVWREGGRGSPRHKSDLYDRKAKAEAALRVKNAQLAALKPAGLVVPWGELVERWLGQLRAGAHHIEVSRKVLTALAAEHQWKGTADVRPDQVTGMRHYHAKHLKAFLRYAQLLDQVVDNRALRLSPPAPPRKPSADLLSEDQVRQLIARATDWHPANGAIAHMVATYGHRPESLVGMPVSAMAGATLVLPVKSGDTIRHPLLSATVALLTQLATGKGPADPLFVGHLGRPWRTGQEYSAWWFHQIGRRVTPGAPGVYELKRYALSRMLGLGLDVATIASITGHRTPAVILKYARTNAARQAEAISALGDTTVTPKKVISH